MTTRSPNRASVLVAVALAAAVVLFVVFAGGGSESRTFTAKVDAADDILSGQEINAGGRKVGSVIGVEPVEKGHRAKIKMKITDGAYWPLPKDTKMDIRFGGTVSFSNRYLLLHRGTSGESVPDGGALRAGAVKTPVEVDAFVNDFPSRTRKDLKRLIGNAAPVVDIGGPDLHAALAPDKLPLVVTGAAKLAADLTKDDARLRTLVRSTSSVLQAADTASPGLRPLLDGFAQTADAVAAQSVNLKTTLTRFPAALRQTRKTLVGASETLQVANKLTDKLSPGIDELQASVTPLRAALHQVRVSTRVAVPALDKAANLSDFAHLLNQATARVPILKSILTQANTQLNCLRPYTPELAFFGTVWGDFTNPVDTRDHVVRANVQNFLPAQFNSVPYSAAEAAKDHPGLEYGFPRPPGQLAAQPWFLPECGITEDSLNPAKDPESANFIANQKRGSK